MAKFINKKDGDDRVPAEDGRMIYFSKTPPQAGDRQDGTDKDLEKTEFSKITKDKEERIFEPQSVRNDKISTIASLIEEEKKEIQNIQKLIKKQAHNLERARNIFKEKQSVLEMELNKQSSMFSDDKFTIMGQMSSKMAHDIRNPLNVIKVQVDLLKLRYSKEEDGIMLESLDRMERAVNGITSQINDVLNFLKEAPTHFEPVSFGHLVESSLSYVQKPDDIAIEVPQNDVTVVCDRDKMERVLMNMIQNSIHAMEGGGTIKFTASESEYGMTMEITDTGPGIPEENLPKIFEPLFTTKRDGTGLGLAICKKIIEDHEGTLCVKNNPTTFIITLPKH